MKLLRLHLKDFKGVKEFTLDINGQNASIFGTNATGKTTIFDAFTWLLFDKDSTNRKDFEIKTLTPEGEALHNLNHEVEAVLDVGGQEITLRKVYAEKWTKKRGQAQTEFTGHTTNHFIDDVPKSQKEYATCIAGIADESVFKLLTSPTYFNEQLHWQERRRILLEICGDISDQDVITSDKTLATLPEILGDHMMEDYRKIISAKRTKINDELKQIPVRIDEATRALPSLSDITDPAALPDDIAKLHKAIQVRNGEISRIENGWETIEKTKAIRIIEVEMLGILKKDREQYDAQVQEKQKDLMAAELRRNTLQNKIKSLEMDIDPYEYTVNNAQAKLPGMRQQWNEIHAQQFTFEQSSTCPSCGQTLPQEKIDDAWETAIKAFNLSKAQKLEENFAEGKHLAGIINEAIVDIKKLQERLNKAKEALPAEEIAVDLLRTDIEDLRQASANFAGGQAYTQKQHDKTRIEKEITDLQECNAGAITNVRVKIQNLQQDLSTLEDAQAKIRQREQGWIRIDELEKQEKKLAAEFERMEGDLYLCDEFTRTKVEMLNERINSKFKLARFKMFETQVNGGLDECCETVFDGVPYSGGLNNAARINVGLDIINTLSQHNGLDAPIFIDNSEAVTQLIPTAGQVIKLVVSEPDKALRVEIDDYEIKEEAI
jgi:DNA repair exonuclease SbcCD ATPase subunit